MSGNGFAAPVVVTGFDFRFVVTEQLLAEGIDPDAVLIEPAGRNTVLAVLAAALHVSVTDPEALILVAPSDHALLTRMPFARPYSRGFQRHSLARIVTFGIAPTRAETGYGWLEIDRTAAGAAPLKLFVEKPVPARAEAMLAAGNFLWNAGIFLSTARTIIAAYQAHAPSLVAPVRRAVELAKADLGFLRLDAEAWGRAEATSVDYAVMEHCPQQNGIVERVIRTLKEQCIHRQRFDSIQHATRAIGD